MKGHTNSRFHHSYSGHGRHSLADTFLNKLEIRICDLCGWSRYSLSRSSFFSILLEQGVDTDPQVNVHSWKESKLIVITYHISLLSLTMWLTCKTGLWNQTGNLVLISGTRCDQLIDAVAHGTDQVEAVYGIGHEVWDQESSSTLKWKNNLPGLSLSIYLSLLHTWRDP